jgi:nucleoside-diphosphate kinase
VSSGAVERTLVLLKPDAVARGLVGEAIARFERKGLDLLAIRMLRLSVPQAETHYAEHRGKPFYDGLVRFITSGPIVALVLEGVGCVKTVRGLVGATCGRDAAPGTIRGDLGMSGRYNLVHASDSVDAAAREIALFFAAEQIVTPADKPWTYDRSDGDPI